MVVSILSTQPCLSYILIEFSSTQCFMRTPSTLLLIVLITSPLKRVLQRLWRKRITSSELKCSIAWWIKPWIQLFKTGSILEDDVCGILNLSKSPVVAMQIKSAMRFEQRIKSLAKSIREAMPVSVEHGVGYLMCLFYILNPCKAILTALIRYPCFIHLRITGISLSFLIALSF